MIKIKFTKKVGDVTEEIYVGGENVNRRYRIEYDIYLFEL